MPRALTRTSFHSASLIRVLADLSLLDTVEPGPAFAEKLGLWVDFADAIALSAVHSAATASPPRKSGGLTAAERLDLGKAFASVQAGLVHSIGRAHLELPAPEADAPGDPALAYEPYRRCYLAQQREFELKLRPLRTRAREVLGRSSARLRKLAALDAALDDILFERESKLLLKLPSLLEKRFKQLRKAQQPANDWLPGFCQEMQTVLLAEMDLRMQPVLGLIEAHRLDSTTG